MIRIGIEGARPAVLAAVRERKAPVLVSANSLWNDERRRWRETWRAYTGFDVALDSGGFVAMQRYGRYRWSVDAYTALAGEMAPTWWAQMDYCCEPEVAVDRHAVCRRIDLTAASLRECRAHATVRGVPPPLIVLQGWKPQDYVSGPAFDDPHFEWPALVGIGSVCRRHLHGDDGLFAVIAALDRKLPLHVRFHFFGVKGRALAHLGEHPRFGSMDSMAWNMAARWESWKTGAPCDAALRAAHLVHWHRQQSHLLQPQPQQLLNLN